MNVMSQRRKGSCTVAEQYRIGGEVTGTHDTDTRTGCENKQKADLLSPVAELTKYCCPLSVVQSSHDSMLDFVLLVWVVLLVTTPPWPQPSDAPVNGLAR